jgi:hypothetical protein
MLVMLFAADTDKLPEKDDPDTSAHDLRSAQCSSRLPVMGTDPWRTSL